MAHTRSCSVAAVCLTDGSTLRRRKGLTFTQRIGGSGRELFIKLPSPSFRRVANRRWTPHIGHSTVGTLSDDFRLRLRRIERSPWALCLATRGPGVLPPSPRTLLMLAGTAGRGGRNAHSGDKDGCAEVPFSGEPTSVGVERGRVLANCLLARLWRLAQLQLSTLFSWRPRQDSNLRPSA